MTVKEIFAEMKSTAKANTESIGFIYYIEYTSKNKLTMLRKMVDKFEADSDIDCELGIITAAQHIKEAIVVKIMRDSIANALERI